MTDIDVSEAVSDIARRGCLAWLHVSRPSLRVKLSADTLGLPAGLETLATSATGLPPGSSYGTFATLESRARLLLAKAAVTKGDGKFVPYKSLDALVQEIEAIRTEYMTHVGRYLESYDADVEAGLVAWTSEANKIYDRLRREDSTVRENDRELFVENLLRAVRSAWQRPTEDQFSMSLRVLAFSIPGVGQASDASFVADAAKRMINDTLSGFTAELVGELRARTAETMTKVLTALRSGSAFREASLTPLRAFLAQFEGLNVMGDEVVAQRVAAVRAALGGATAETVRTDEGFREALTGALAEAATVGDDLVRTAEQDAKEMLSRRYGGGLRKVAV